MSDKIKLDNAWSKLNFTLRAYELGMNNAEEDDRMNLIKLDDYDAYIKNLAPHAFCLMEKELDMSDFLTSAVAPEIFKDAYIEGYTEYLREKTSERVAVPSSIMEARVRLFIDPFSHSWGYTLEVPGKEGTFETIPSVGYADREKALEYALSHYNNGV